MASLNIALNVPAMSVIMIITTTKNSKSKSKKSKKVKGNDADLIQNLSTEIASNLNQLKTLFN